MSHDRILVAIDGSDSSDSALQRATAIAQERGWGIDVLHVIDTRQYGAGFGQVGGVDGRLLYEAEQHAEQDLDAVLKPLLAQGIDAKPHIRFGSPRSVIAIDAVRDYQTSLIVIGRSSKKLVSRMFIGSVASFVVENAACDVLIVANPDTAD
ncbi:universal stress protein [Lacticaseibacillus jixiensis]|uniref:universal stress protein n=1 Tax=Lacticaseibacillus jixiensis TaxID=3231926 RepID=UPI0036F2A191